MNREQLAHVLRAVGNIIDDADDVIVLGSQSILGTFGEDDLPAQATMSIEADIAFADDPETTKADAVDGAIGELSRFHQTFGYYGQGVSLDVAHLPRGWRDRLTPFTRGDTGKTTAFCLDPHDLAIAKLSAGREKDRDFVIALLAAELIQPLILLDRIHDLDRPDQDLDHIRNRIESWARQAGYGMPR